MIICPGCGADMKFDPEKQKLVCRYCDKVLDPKEYHAPKAAEASEQEGYYTATIFTCPQCGAEILSTEETVATLFSHENNAYNFTKITAIKNVPDVMAPMVLSQIHKKVNVEFIKKFNLSFFFCQKCFHSNTCQF